jgi:hypothetical protein
MPACRRFAKSGGVPLVFNAHFTGTMHHWDTVGSACRLSPQSTRFNVCAFAADDRNATAQQKRCTSVPNVSVPCESDFPAAPEFCADKQTLSRANNAKEFQK